MQRVECVLQRARRARHHGQTCRHLHKQVADPELRRKLTPDYRAGCKRMLISNNYYPALDRPNVDLVTDGGGPEDRASAAPPNPRQKQGGASGTAGRGGQL